MEGYLYQRDPHDGTVKRLFFVLKGFKMYLYAEQGELDHIDQVNLLDVSRIDSMHPNTPGFAIVTEDDIVYALEAESTPEKDKWVRALGEVTNVAAGAKEKKRKREEEERRVKEEQERRAREEQERERRFLQEEQYRNQFMSKRRVEFSAAARGEFAVCVQDYRDALRRKRVEETEREARQAVARCGQPQELIKHILHGGAPHGRFFRLNESAREFSWGPKVDKASTTFKINEITKITAGLVSDVFKHNAGLMARGSQAAARCFSVYTSKRSVDCEAPSEAVRDQWLLALRFLRFGLEYVMKEMPAQGNPFEDPVVVIAQLPRPALQQQAAAAATVSAVRATPVEQAHIQAMSETLRSTMPQRSEASAAAGSASNAAAAQANGVANAAAAQANGVAGAANHAVHAAEGNAQHAAQHAQQQAQQQAGQAVHQAEAQAQHAAQQQANHVAHEAQHAAQSATNQISHGVSSFGQQATNVGGSLAAGIHIR